MQRQQARRRFNAEPITCQLCQQQQPNYRILLNQQHRLICYNCCTQSAHQVRNIKIPYKEHCQQIIKQLPLPDYQNAKECLQTIETLRTRTNSTLKDIRGKLDSFENDLKEFFEQTAFICQGYIDKLKGIEDAPVKSWQKSPPKLIDQQKYVFNIKQKQQLAFKIQQSLKQLQFKLPNIEDIKRQTHKYSSKTICQRVSITAAAKVKGALFVGTNDGRIIYEGYSLMGEIKAHDSQIRDFQYDGQFKLFSSSDDQIVKLWDLRDQVPKLITSFGLVQGIRSSHRELVLVDAGRCLASSRGQFDQYRIRVWDLNNYNNLKTLQGHTGYIKGMLVTDSNQLVSVAEDRSLKVWDLKTCEVISQLYHSGRINYVFYSSAAQLLCIIDDTNRVTLLDLQTLNIYAAIWAGKKIHFAQANSFIYLYTDRYLSIYSWNLCLLEKVELLMPYLPTSIVEVVSRLMVTDANGSLHQLTPQCLKSLNS